MMMLNVLLAALPLISAPEAPFVEKPVDLETPTPVLKADRIEAGTKALTWQNREDNLEIVADGRCVAKFQTRVEPTFPGWQPFQTFDVQAGADAVMRSYAFGLTKTVKGEYVQRFSVEGGRAVVISQFKVPEGVALKQQTFVGMIPRDTAKGRTIRFVDAKGKVTNVKIADEAKWDNRKNPKDPLWSDNGWCADPVELTFDPEHPATSYTLRFPAGTFGRIVLYRSLSGLHVYPYFKSETLGRPIRMEVDFGQCAKATAGDCVIDGINFTKNNDFEVLRWGRRNLFNNPSFEAGPRYWHDTYSAADLNRSIVSDAHSGRFGFMLGTAKCFCLPTKSNRKYTFSCWAKSVNGDGGSIALSSYNYTWGGGNVRTYFSLRKGTKDWQRFTYTFDWKYRGIMLMLAPSDWKYGRIVIDDLQLEEGDRATDFECPPYAMELRTDSPDRYFADAAQPFNPRLVIRGAAGAKGVAKITVRDFYARETWRGERPFAIGPDGETVIPACPEEAVSRKGTNVIRVELDDGAGRPVVDHLRLVRYKYATGKEPSRELHQLSDFGNATRGMLKVPDWNWHRCDSLGIQIFSRTLCDYFGPYDAELRRKAADFYLGHGARIKQPVFQGTIKRPPAVATATPIYHYMNEEGIAWDNMPDVTKGYAEAEYAAIGRAVERLARENPWCVDWIGTSELGVRWNMTKIHDYKELARIMMVTHRALKKVNPAITFVPHGTCNAGPQGRAEIHEFMEASKAVDPDFVWDGFQVHPYRAHPEFPSLESDLRQLYDDMARHKMPNGVVFADEGAYFLPIICKEWNDIGPWSGTAESDQYYHMGMPGYDVGWGERVATAMVMRYSLQCYRFLPRLKYVNIWMGYLLDSDLPKSTHVGMAAETELLGYATYRSDIRFGDGARAYFYDDGKGGAIAAIWKFNVALDRGLEKAAEMYVDSAFLAGCEIFDMMGNLCESKSRVEVEGGSKAVLPLSNFPIFLRVPIAKMDALVAAVKGCTTSDDGKVRKLYDPPVTDIPHCGEKPDWTAVAPIALPYVQQSQPRRVRGEKGGGPDDLSATCKMAWNEKGIFLRVEAKDDVFCLDRSTYRYGEQQWYACEGVQVFFDSLGDGRENFKMEMTGFAEDDSLYELLPTSEKSAVVFRRVAPDIQQTGGVGDPLKPNVLEPAVVCDFKWDPAKKTRTYEAFFPARQLQPMVLKAGSKIGCSFVVYDRDERGPHTKQWVTDVPLEVGAPYEHPHLYSNFVLTR